MQALQVVAPERRPAPSFPILAGMVCACAIPPLVAYNPVSTSSIFCQLLAIAGWGLVMIAMGARPLRWSGGALNWALLILALAPWVSVFSAGSPVSLALSSSGILVLAMLIYQLGHGLEARAGVSCSRAVWFEAVSWAFFVTAFFCSLVALIQVFLPAVADGDFIARTSITGRAIGNMRQPNHLALFLLLGVAGGVYLADRGRFQFVFGRELFGLLQFGFVLGVALTASRAALACLVVLSVWGWIDKRLGRNTRWVLKTIPLALLLSWVLIAIWAQNSQVQFHAASRLNEGLGSPKRWLVLSDAWSLLKQHPWAGIGWGEFNFAWTMVENSSRAMPAFDHTHNLLMQLLLELGWPVGGLVLFLVFKTLFQLFKFSVNETTEDASLYRCALLMVGSVLIFSMVEFPFWYAYFLFPMVFVLGMTASGARSVRLRDQAYAAIPAKYLGALALVISVTAYLDYLRIVVIRDESGLDIPIWENVVEAQQRSVLFPVYADRYAALMLSPGRDALVAARRAAHLICDEPLLMSWSKSLAAEGDLDRARYVAQRLREFKTPQVNDWFEVCNKPPSTAKVLPYQCQAPERRYDLHEMR
ncbi:MAG: hypothetical protein CFE41_04950 [Burkholderiales bacterium PBB2]|nr:MAG: hypothetical protein CFE41_04950 [Burkholderiales bacterium PBB2]